MPNILTPRLASPARLSRKPSLSHMSQAFRKEPDPDTAPDDETDAPAGALPPQARGKNYLTAAGHARLRAELLHLLDVERPRVVEVVHWAASNGDRSENGDYLYGKKRLREIDRRIRFLTRRLDIAVVVDPALQHGSEQVFFGARVRYARADGSEATVQILGIDEAEPSLGQISWVAPVAQALLKARVGDEVRVHTPAGWETLEVLEVSYPAAAAAGAAPAPPAPCA